MRPDSQHAANPQTSDSTAALGADFSALRQRQGLDIEAVAEHLRCTLTAVREIEAGHFAYLGARLVIRSYLERYARLLGVEPQDYLERFARLQPEDALRVDPLAKPQRAARAPMHQLRWLVTYPLSLVIIGWLAWSTLHLFARHVGVGLEQLASTPQTKPLLLARGGHQDIPLPLPPNPSEPAPTESPINPELASSAHQDGPADAPLPLQTTPVATQDAVSEPHHNTSLVPPAVANTAPPATAQPSEQRDGPRLNELVLAFSDACWVNIHDAEDRRLAYGLMQEGTISTLSGKAPFRITLGNAPSVRITLDGRTIEDSIFLPKRGTVSRFVLDPTTL